MAQRKYGSASPMTVRRRHKRLLELWRSGDRMQRLFFAQIEAVETIIFLAEAREIYRKGCRKFRRMNPASIQGRWLSRLRPLRLQDGDRLRQDNRHGYAGGVVHSQCGIATR